MFYALQRQFTITIREDGAWKLILFLNNCCLIIIIIFVVPSSGCSGVPGVCKGVGGRLLFRRQQLFKQFCVNVANICCSVRAIINKQANTHTHLHTVRKTRVFQVVSCWSETPLNDGPGGEPGIGNSGEGARLPSYVCHASVGEDSSTKWGKRQVKSRRQVQGAMTHASGPIPSRKR